MVVSKEICVQGYILHLRKGKLVKFRLTIWSIQTVIYSDIPVTRDRHRSRHTVSPSDPRPWPFSSTILPGPQGERWELDSA